jgi:hypothetical protein
MNIPVRLVSANLDSCEPAFAESSIPQDLPREEPEEYECPPEELNEPSDLEELDFPDFDDDARWDAFIADDDERDPQLEPGDFWIDFDGGANREAA